MVGARIVRCKVFYEMIPEKFIYDLYMMCFMHFDDKVKWAVVLIINAQLAPFSQQLYSSIPVACTVGGFGGLSTPLSSQTTMKLI